MLRLTINVIFYLLSQLRPFQITADMKTKVENLTLTSIYNRTINYREICNVPFDRITCPLQKINNIEPISFTVHDVKACFFHELTSKNLQF